MESLEDVVKNRTSVDDKKANELARFMDLKDDDERIKNFATIKQEIEQIQTAKTAEGIARKRKKKDVTQQLTDYVDYNFL